MKGMSMPMDERDWQAENDARCLMDAEEVKADPSRVKAAIAASKRMADEKMQEAMRVQNLMKGPASGGSSSGSYPKITGVTGRH